MMHETKVEMNEAPSKRRVIVVGAGIAGLATAYYLRKHGVDVKIFERGKAVGGLIRTTLEKERYLVEHGPIAFPSNEETLIKLARELSVDTQLVSSPASCQKRYVLRHGKLVALPLGLQSFLTTRALSFTGKLRLLAEPWISPCTEEEESIASFVRRRAGNEVLERLLDPLVSGIYAGDPEQLSMRSVFPHTMELEEEYGSVLKGMIKTRKNTQKRAKTLSSFRWGMGTIPARLEEVLRRELQLQTTVDSVERLPQGSLSIRLEAPRRTFEADAVVLATPAWVTARLVASVAPGMTSPLVGIPYVSLVVVTTAFKRDQVPHKLDGFGCLIPRCERVRMLGSIWSSTLFSGRAASDEVLFTNFIGGALDSTAIELEDHEILSHISDGLEKTVGVMNVPTFVSIRRREQALPQYVLGHQKRIDDIVSEASRVPGLFLTGNYFSHVSVPGTIEHARTTADRVLKFFGMRSILKT
ncbi:MAG: protoporphyrinogen oxidase [Deltaproteobacteria bacterium RIFCSPHIGHO2_02_FULL_44_16]|nr:MAG: protoporphyrinogen oxidase [Deltaproteobacteria bacterium RIFCSPHIGHO2_02_FULL_44_16]